VARRGAAVVFARGHAPTLVDDVLVTLQLDAYGEQVGTEHAHVHRVEGPQWVPADDAALAGERVVAGQDRGDARHPAEPPATRSRRRTRGSWWILRTYPARGPCSAMIQKVPPIRPFPTGVRRGLTGHAAAGLEDRQTQRIEADAQEESHQRVDGPSLDGPHEQGHVHAHRPARRGSTPPSASCAQTAMPSSRSNWRTVRLNACCDTKPLRRHPEAQLLRHRHKRTKMPQLRTHRPMIPISRQERNPNGMTPRARDRGRPGRGRLVSRSSNTTPRPDRGRRRQRLPAGSRCGRRAGAQVETFARSTGARASSRETPACGP